MIGTLNESPLHQALKAHYCELLEGAVAETPVAGYVADVVSGQAIYEIQTSGLGSMRGKLQQLLTDFQVVVVHPIAVCSYIVKLSQDGDGTFTRRRSPKRGRLLNLFDELVSVPALLEHPNFELEVVLVDQELVREHAQEMRRGRGGWRTVERRLLTLQSTHRFRSHADLWALLTQELSEPFDTLDLAGALDCPRSLAQKFAYCMNAAGQLKRVGKTGNSIRYVRQG